jgi:hypothetical protein
MNKANIFNNVVKSENSMTELLLNFSSYEIFRNELLRLFLKEPDVETVEYDHLSTQKRLPNGEGQPDFFIQNDKLEILIEIKTDDTGLTNNQPTKYIEYLTTINKEKLILVFLIPSWYKYREEWNKRVDNFKKENKISIQTEIIEWESIIGIIDSHDFLNFNQCFVEFLGLMKNWFETKAITFSNAEVTLMYNEKSIPLVMKKLFEIVDKVKDYNSKHTKIWHNKDSGEYSIYFKNNEGKNVLYFGVWFEFWSKYSKPLCFGVSENFPKKYQEIFKKNHPDAISMVYDDDNENWNMAWIDSEILSDERNPALMINKIIEQELLELIR